MTFVRKSEDFHEICIFSGNLDIFRKFGYFHEIFGNKVIEGWIEFATFVRKSEDFHEICIFSGNLDIFRKFGYFHEIWIFSWNFREKIWKIFRFLEDFKIFGKILYLGKFSDLVGLSQSGHVSSSQKLPGPALREQGDPWHTCESGKIQANSISHS